MASAQVGEARAGDDSTLAERIARNLIALRDERNITPSQLARMADVSIGYIQKLERADTDNPSLVHLQKIAAALGVPLDALTGDEQKRTQSVEEQIDTILQQYLPGRPVEVAREILRLLPDLDSDELREAVGLLRVKAEHSKARKKKRRRSAG